MKKNLKAKKQADLEKLVEKSKFTENDVKTLDHKIKSGLLKRLQAFEKNIKPGKKGTRKDLKFLRSFKSKSKLTEEEALRLGAELNKKLAKKYLK